MTADEDAPRRSVNIGELRLSAADIIAFARDFDPQPQHVDARAAKETVLGGLCASGWQTCAAINRLFVDWADRALPPGAAARFEEVRWKAPVYADRAYPVRAEITARKGAVTTVKLTACGEGDKPVAVITALWRASDEKGDGHEARP